jgi:hypothetical protein
VKRETRVSLGAAISHLAAPLSPRHEGHVGQVPIQQKDGPAEEATPILKETFPTGIAGMF